MEPNNMYLAIMSDILDSGTWANLGPAAKALYPVLCKFSNHTFKPVWPGTDELLRLTGFKTKKSLQEAKRELIKQGLLHIVAGTGRTSSHYYFRFDYRGSKVDIEAHRENAASRRGVQESPPGGHQQTPVRGAEIPPNHINIHINKLTQTTNNNNPDLSSLLNEFFGAAKPRGDFKEHLVQEMLEKYGSLEVGEAVRIAISKGKDGDIRYLEGILKNRGSDKGKKSDPASGGFSFETVSPSLKIWQNHLESLGRFGDTWYFSAKTDLSPSFVEEQFKRAGVQVKIVKPAAGRDSASDFAAAN
jgi:Helix-turn-helix domain